MRIMFPAEFGLPEVDEFTLRKGKGGKEMNNQRLRDYNEVLCAK